MIPTATISAPTAIHSNVSMPCSSFRYPRTFFIPVSSCAPRRLCGEACVGTALNCTCDLLILAARSRIPWPASPPSCGRLTARLHLVRPHVWEPVTLQRQHHGRHPIPRDPKPHRSRLDHLELVVGDLTEEACLLEHLEDQRSLATVVAELHDHERLRVAHARSLSNLREAPEVIAQPEPLVFLEVERLECRRCAKIHGVWSEMAR